MSDSGGVLDWWDNKDNLKNLTSIKEQTKPELQRFLDNFGLAHNKSDTKDALAAKVVIQGKQMTKDKYWNSPHSPLPPKSPLQDDAAEITELMESLDLKQNQRG